MAAQWLRNRFAITAQPLRNHCAFSAIASLSLHDRTESALQSICNYSPIAQPLLYNRFATALQSICNRRSAIASQLLCDSCTITAIVAQSPCNRYSIVAQSPCNHSTLASQLLRDRFAITSDIFARIAFALLAAQTGLSSNQYLSHQPKVANEWPVSEVFENGHIVS
jgi:hypothetical protein